MARGGWEGAVDLLSSLFPLHLNLPRHYLHTLISLASHTAVCTVTAEQCSGCVCTHVRVNVFVHAYVPHHLVDKNQQKSEALQFV